jgi:hypothetical protein
MVTDPNKLQAIILFILTIGGLAGWFMELDVTPFGLICAALIGFTEKMKADIKTKEKQDG